MEGVLTAGRRTGNPNSKRQNDEDQTETSGEQDKNRGTDKDKGKHRHHIKKGRGDDGDTLRQVQMTKVLGNTRGGEVTNNMRITKGNLTKAETYKPKVSRRFESGQNRDTSHATYQMQN